MTKGPPLDERELYRVLAETTEDAIVTIDEESTILSLNPSAERLFGYAAHELVGRPLSQVMPERYRARHAAGVARYLATGRRTIPWKGVEVPVLTRDGRELPVQISFGEFTSGPRRVFSAIIRDVSARVAADAALAASTDQLEAQTVELEQQVDEAQTISEELEQTNEELRNANHALHLARAEAEQSSARVRELLDSLTDAVCVYDRRWSFTYVNPAAHGVLRLLGIVPESVPGRVLWEVLPQLTGTSFHGAARQALRSGESVTLVETLPGTDRLFEHRIVPSGAGVTSFSRDVTEQQRANEALRAREVEFRALANSIPSLAWTARADGYIDWYNDRWYEYTGTTPADMEGWGWQQVHDPAVLPDVLEQWTRSISTGQPFEMTFPLRGADGHFRHFLTRVAPATDEQGRVVRWFGTNADVELERAAREAVLRAMERAERLQALTAALAEVTGADEIADVVIARAAAAAGARSATLFMLDRQTQEGYLARQLGLDEASLESWQRFPITRAGPSAQCLRTGQPMFLQSLDEVLRAFPELRATWRRLGAHALVTVPLTVSAEVVGAMSFTYDEPRTFPLEDREFYLAVARQAAQALDRARLRSETQQLLDALERERRRLADVFRQAPVAVAVLRGRATEELVFEMANPRYLELVPPEPHPVGMRVFDALPDAGAPLLDVLRRVLATGETVVVQEMQVGVDRDGDGVAEDYWFTATYHPLREQGEIGAIVAVITEVTENVRARQEAERLRAEAEGANRAKGEFLAVMSHELRTPLNAIGGYVELIELGIRGPVTEEQRMDLARIQQSQRHLLGLINEVLNYARLETGSVNYDMVRVPLRDALRSAEALVAPQAHLKGLSLRTDDCPESMAVVADPEKLRQVLVNLLSNAVKFTDAGGAITLGARARGNTVAITVTDTGIGIAGEQMERIFEPFVQVRSDLTRTAEGTGLGLAISRDLARGMGGDLTAESVLGEGSRFVITLPAAAANEGAGGRRDRP